MAPAGEDINVSAGGSTEHKVCVMNAAGTLGSALVEELLRRGYSVNAAASSSKGRESRRLEALVAEHDGCHHLKIFWSDPFDYQSIIDAIKGCSGLFYSFEQEQELEEEEEEPLSRYDAELMAELEVRAAHNVLEACAQSESIKKVVFTSSVTAVVWKENRSTSGAEMDERDWSETAFCSKFKLWHALSKTLSERTAWALAMDRGVHMVAVNPGLLLSGPQLSLRNPYLKGSPEMYRDGVLVAVDLGFLVDAHVCVYESSSAYGRYLCFNHAVCRPGDAVNLARRLDSSSPCTSPHSSDGLMETQQRIHNKKMNKLMVDFNGKLSTRVTMIEQDINQ